MTSPLFSSHSKPGKRIRIFLGEAQEHRGKPLYRRVLEEAYSHTAIAATVVRGIEGFGPEHILSTDRFPDLADNLPIVIDIVTHEERAAPLLAALDEIVLQGMITTTPIEILLSTKNE
ncbi:DUF190 domain-containing protein [Dictyobacter formicarum]|uniref:DUF190 domain-containing protein n=1 Tax=Dictyobacter formicarum TaxID=2778368 RepID=A0ABQ3VD20_9CHLR|nr:DUF190 domain-containing protein [Dictyobacter formicarum]GHO84050.1 hypothetical protein KSZ_20560 [Dictyobacter formicarum]